MSAALTKLPPTVPKLIRLLATDNDAECISACRALGRALRAAKSDFNDLAAAIERGGAAHHQRASSFDCPSDSTGSSCQVVPRRQALALLEGNRFPDRPVELDRQAIRQAAHLAVRHRGKIAEGRMTLSVNETEMTAPQLGGARAELGLLLQLGAIAEGAEAVAEYADAAFDFAVEGDVPAIAIAVGRIEALVAFMRTSVTELTIKKGNCTCQNI